MEMLRQLLELEGAAVMAASSAAQALALLEQQRIDFVISDIAMPDVDGYQFVQKLKDQPALRDLPVIALTGMGRPTDARRAVAAGFAAHLKKPVTLEKLLNTLRTVLPGRG
jgi:two-component system CheB/CheR fusion protein